MISLPSDFDADRARAVLSSAWSSASPAGLAAAFAEAQAPIYDKAFTVGPKLRPAHEAFDAEAVPAAMTARDPAAFEVAMEVLGRTLDADGIVRVASEVAACKPWARLRTLAFEAAARTHGEAGFRFLLGHPSASAFLLKSDFPGESLVMERLTASPMMAPSEPGPSRSEFANWPEAKRNAFQAERAAANEAMDSVKHGVVSDLVTYLGTKGSEPGLEVVRGLLASGARGSIRSRAAGALFKGGRRGDLELLTRYTDDRDTVVRHRAIGAVLSLDIGAAWERLSGDRLMQPGSEADADELLNILARDLSGTGGQPVRGWARQEPRFIELAKKWLGKKKMRNPEFLLQALGEKPMIGVEWRSRHSRGEGAEVWTELRRTGALDGAARAEALEVARETMRRVRSAVSAIVDLLTDQGYRFAHPRRTLVAPAPDTEKLIAALEARSGPLPLALRAAWEVVGSFDLTGTHPDWPVTACLMVPGEKEGPGGVWMTDPVVLYAPSEVMARLDDHADEYDSALPVWPDAFHKAGYSGGPETRAPVGMVTADAELVTGDSNPRGPRTLVGYLVWALAEWGGFPGFEAMGAKAWPGLETLVRAVPPLP